MRQPNGYFAFSALALFLASSPAPTLKLTSRFPLHCSVTHLHKPQYLQTLGETPTLALKPLNSPLLPTLFHTPSALIPLPPPTCWNAPEWLQLHKPQYLHTLEQRDRHAELKQQQRVGCGEAKRGQGVLVEQDGAWQV